MIKLNPLTIKQIKRFKSIKRGYFSFIILIVMIIFSLFAELLINNKALMVYFNNKLYFPVFGKMKTGKTFGFDYDYETNYRDLKNKFSDEKSKNWVIMPLIPYNPYEDDARFKPYPYHPDIGSKHLLGTDTSGRDVLARLIYGFRLSIVFSLVLLIFNYFIGITIGCFMGYYGKAFDIIIQRIIEIWHNMPFLYVVIIITSSIRPNLLILIVILAFFEWIGMTWVMRTVTYREKEREYVAAAKSLGASDFRIIFTHILPNTLSIIITYIPFSIASGIISLTSLDFLGFGLKPPSPSWGEMLQQGWSRLSDYWIAGSVIFFMVLTLVLVTFIGEALREAFDPKLYTKYE